MSHEYYVPKKSHWPLVGSFALFFLAIGTVNLIHDQHHIGLACFFIGALIFIFTLFGWFSTVINESQQGLYNTKVDRSYRWGMIWFIASEVMFFAAFFGALFYARNYSVPWLGGQGAAGSATNIMLWPDFQAAWPLYKNPDPAIIGPHKVIHAFGIPTLNTFLLLSSAVTITWAHWALIRNQREKLIAGLMLTIFLGSVFIGCQIYEYILAHYHYGLTIYSGIYGTTFFMLTGFHGAHVTLGLIMLIVILIRCLKGHFNPNQHFAFEACAWYWHFVDVVWLFLYIFVYWL